MILKVFSGEGTITQPVSSVFPDEYWVRSSRYPGVAFVEDVKALLNGEWIELDIGKDCGMYLNALYQWASGLENPVITGKVVNGGWGVAFAATVVISNWYVLSTAWLQHHEISCKLHCRSSLYPPSGSSKETDKIRSCCQKRLRCAIISSNSSTSD